MKRKVSHFTFHLFDAAQSVLKGVQRCRLVVVPLLRGQVKLELFQGFNDLLLGLGFGRLLTATVGQPQTRRAATQKLHNHYLRQKNKTRKIRAKRLWFAKSHMNVQDEENKKTKTRGAPRDGQDGSLTSCACVFPEHQMATLARVGLSQNTKLSYSYHVTLS